MTFYFLVFVLLLVSFFVSHFSPSTCLYKEVENCFLSEQRMTAKFLILFISYCCQGLHQFLLPLFYGFCVGIENATLAIFYVAMLQLQHLNREPFAIRPFLILSIPSFSLIWFYGVRSKCLPDFLGAYGNSKDYIKWVWSLYAMNIHLAHQICNSKNDRILIIHDE